MAALPYIQLYVADYLADTIHFETDEHGAYLLLIMNYWQTGKPIPGDRVLAITKLSNERWTTTEIKIQGMFNVLADGCWQHDRIDADLQRVRTRSDKAKRAGMASADKRKTTRKQAQSNKRSTSTQKPVQRPLIYKETETDTETDKEKEKEQKEKELSFSPSDIPMIISEYRKHKAGTNGIHEAKVKLEKILKAGKWSADDLVLAIRRYGQECVTTGSFMKTASVFFGVKEHFVGFLEDYQEAQQHQEKKGRQRDATSQRVAEENKGAGKFDHLATG